MRRTLLTLATLCSLLAPITLSTPMAQAAQPAAPAIATPTRAARVIVKFKPDAALMKTQSASHGGRRYPQHAQALSQRLGMPLEDGHPISEHMQLISAKGISSAELAARLAQQDDVEFAEPDLRRHITRTPNDPLYLGGQVLPTTPTVGQWYLRAPDSTTVAAINAAHAWDFTTGSSTTVVAVLDTGVRFEHPDLAGKLYPGYDFIADVATANDGNGRDADASDPGDWVTDAEVNDATSPFYHCTDPDSSGKYSGEPSSWHGTQVSGLIGAATHNAIGMASVGWHTMILPVRVLGKCGGTDSDIQAAMLWAAGLINTPVANPHPAKVINISLGSSGSCTQGYQAVMSQLTAAGVTVVASAGNDEGLAVNTPANCPGVIAVAGVRHIGTKVGFSSIGPEVTISSPAGNCVNIGAGDACVYPILTTVNTGTTTPASNTYSNSFLTSLGTSFSSPLVAGTAALMLTVDPTLTPAQLKSALQATARPFPSSGSSASTPVCHAPNGQTQDECYCTTSTCGAGLLDAAAAVQAVLPATVPRAPFNASSANVAVGTTVTFDATGATAPSGRAIKSYAWTITNGASLASFTSPTDAITATLLTSGAGTVTVTLTVTDTADVATSASANVNVSAGPVPVIVPTSTSVQVGSTITLDGSSSSAPSGRTITQYQWSITAGSSFATLSGSNTPMATLTAVAPGTVTVTLTVTDSAGAQASTSSSISVTPVPSAGGGGGGGALGLPWLLALASAVVFLRRARQR